MGANTKICDFDKLWKDFEIKAFLGPEIMYKISLRIKTTVKVYFCNS